MRGGWDRKCYAAINKGGIVMNIISCIFLALFGMASGATSVTVRVADGDTCNPVDGALVEIAFLEPPTVDGVERDIVFTRKTNAHGICGASGPKCFDKVWFKVEKDGYYDSRGTHEFILNEDGNLCSGVSVVTVSLMRIVRPIPLFVGDEPAWRPYEMFGKGTNTLEFDFMEGDYLPPVGNGKVPDVVFTRDKCQVLFTKTSSEYGVWHSTRDQVRVHFPNPGDGIVSMPTNAWSRLQIRTAPESGYKPDYLCDKVIGTNDVFESWAADPNLCFRIRTRFDMSGNVTNAHYGKIYRGLGFNHSYSNEKVMEPRAERMRFLYYLNPVPMERNLEYDKLHNLKKYNGPVMADP